MDGRRGRTLRGNKAFGLVGDMAAEGAELGILISMTHFNDDAIHEAVFRPGGTKKPLLDITLLEKRQQIKSVISGSGSLLVMRSGVEIRRITGTDGRMKEGFEEEFDWKRNPQQLPIRPLLIERLGLKAIYETSQTLIILKGFAPKMDVSLVLVPPDSDEFAGGDYHRFPVQEQSLS